MKKLVHIVCFDVPYPVSHGGYFDLYYKLVALQSAGMEISLHCFEYGRGEQSILESLCKKVSYYPRKKFSGLSATLPYIVSTRISERLIRDLSADDHPILLEGTHTTYLLHRNVFPGRKILYRLHNIENVYYLHLYRSETNLLKKLYFFREYRFLARYEATIASRASQVLAVSAKDKEDYKRSYPDAQVSYLPLFIPFKKVVSLSGKGDFVLYHGNLSVPENEKAALLLMKVFKGSTLPLVIAGRHPSKKLTRLSAGLKNVILHADPEDEKMEQLICNAHINIIYSFNATGIKIKLLHALFSGRHCVINNAALPGEAFKEFCHVVEEKTGILALTEKLMAIEFNDDAKTRRQVFLSTHFDNARNAETLSAFLQ